MTSTPGSERQLNVDMRAGQQCPPLRVAPPQSVTVTVRTLGLLKELRPLFPSPLAGVLGRLTRGKLADDLGIDTLTVVLVNQKP